MGVVVAAPPLRSARHVAVRDATAASGAAAPAPASARRLPVLRPRQRAASSSALGALESDRRPRPQSTPRRSSPQRPQHQPCSRADSSGAPRRVCTPAAPRPAASACLQLATASDGVVRLSCLLGSHRRRPCHAITRASATTCHHRRAAAATPAAAAASRPSASTSSSTASGSHGSHGGDGGGDDGKSHSRVARHRTATAAAHLPPAAAAASTSG